MKKIFLVFALILFPFFLSAQQVINGIIEDATNKEPVIGASVGIKNSPLGTIANEEGIFRLTVPKDSQIIISCIGYKTLELHLSDFKDDTDVILLEYDEMKLDEVIVSNMPVYKILDDVVITSRARFNKPILVNTYYREFVKLNGKYAKFSDGLLDYHISGTTKKTKSNLIVKESRAAQVTKDEEEDYDPTSILDVQRGVPYYYDFTFVQNTLLDSKNYNDYDWQLKSRKDNEGNELYAINFEPKQGIEKSIYKGTVLYNPATKLIMDIDIYLDPAFFEYRKTINMVIIKLKLMDKKLKASYKIVGGNYVLSYNNRFASVKFWNKNRYDELIESRCDLVVTDFSKDPLTYDKKAVYKEKSLYKRGNKYSHKFWLENNAIVLTNEEAKIIKSLENESAPTP